MHPQTDAFEGVRVGYVVDYNDAVSAAVVAACKGAKSFLSSGVPDLEFDSFVLHVDVLDLVVDTDRVEEVLAKRVVSVPH